MTKYYIYHTGKSNAYIWFFRNIFQQKTVGNQYVFPEFLD
jgi:hypothetical protein